MKKGISALLFLLVLSLAATAQVDKKVASIQKAYQDAVEKARLCETDDEQGEIGALVMNTLSVNTRGHQWRAVGTYRPSYRFFYKTGEPEDEKRLYPDQLVLIKSELAISDRTTTEEFLFDENGQLIYHKQNFVHDEKGPIERVVVFTVASKSVPVKAIRVIENGKPRDRFSALDNSVISDILKSSEKLRDLFRLSINL